MSSKIKKVFSLLFFILATGVNLLSSNLYADVISNNIPPEIQEPAATYDQGGLNVLNMRVDTVISPGSCVLDDYEGCTLNDVLNDINSFDDFKPEIKVHMTADDFPDDGKVSNATMRLRGLISRNDAQKSFRIKLDSKKKLWRDERRIQLVKSMWDFTRVRNKLSYDLFAEIPHFPSMRTQFVHLNVNDQGVNEDYGLYTHIEHFGKEYLKRRNWDKDSRVYKVGFYNFYSNVKLALDTNGVPLNLDAFETKMEIKRGDTHFDIVNMINDLNDPSKDFNTEIMGKYLNRDNYLTWLAVNILVNNTDTTEHNFYLFNPINTEHMYFVPWDYDFAYGQVHDGDLDTIEHLPRWWFTHANWWSNLIHRRFLSEPGNLQLLASALDEVKSKYLTAEKIRLKAEAYRDLIFPILNDFPDNDHIYIGNTDPERIAEYNRLIDSLSTNIQFNYNRFNDQINDPMPFKMDNPTFLSNKNILFKWGESESLTGQTIEYDLEVATTKDFKTGTIIEVETGILAREHTLHWIHQDGTYYFRVRSRDASNPQKYWQNATNNTDSLTYDSDKLPIFGVKKMVVSPSSFTPLNAVNDTATVTVGETIEINVLDNDSGSNIFIYAVDDAKTGEVSISGNKLVYTAGNGTGNLNIWYGIKDSNGTSNWAKVVITVTSGLSANNDSAMVSVGNTITIDAIANDSGSNIFIYAVDDVWTGNISVSGNKLVYNAGNRVGNINVWYGIEDSNGNHDWAMVSISITGGGLLLAANNDSAVVSIGNTITIDAIANDIGSNIFIYAVDDVWTGNISVSGNKLVYNAGNRVGNINVWYGIEDSNGDQDWAKVTINITN